MEGCVRSNQIEELKFAVELMDRKVVDHHEAIPALENRLNEEVELLRE
jgi:hypothetical protein